MDNLSKTLADAHLRGSLLATLDFAAPWSVDFETAPSGAPTHYIISGEAVLKRPGARPLHLAAGDLVMFPRWDAHCLGSPDASVETIAIREVVRRNDGVSWHPGEWLDGPLHLSLDGDGERTRILSMVFELDETTPHPLLLSLPRFIHLRADAIEMGSLLRTTLDFLTNESAHQREGYAVVSSRLADLVFMQILRTQLLSAPGEVAGWLRALTDPAIGATMAAIHDNPGHNWTVQDMARASGLSRSGFCARFKGLTGNSPYQYLRGLKMNLATRRLAEGASVKALAADLGYATSYAFSSAFRQQFGLSPSQYRAAQADPSGRGR